MKIALFDFCETLVSFQTADAFVDFVRERTDSKRMNNLETVFSFLEKFHILDLLDAATKGKYSISKKFKLFQLKNLATVDLEQLSLMYYKEKLKPNLIKTVLKELVKCNNEGYKVLIVSGGYEIYLKHFALEFNVDTVLSTKIEMSGGYCTGKICGRDCMNDYKVTLLNKCYDRSSVYSVAYSDSESDLPMLTWANDAFVISRDRSQKWAINYNLKEIIWDSLKN